MKTVLFNIITPKGYISNSTISRGKGEVEITNIMYTNNVHEAQKFDSQFIKNHLHYYEDAVGIKRGHGLGTPKYRIKKFVIICPEGYVYDYEIEPNTFKVLGLSYTDDIQDAMQFPETGIKELAQNVSNFIEVPLFGGMGYSEVKVTYAH